MILENKLKREKLLRKRVLNRFFFLLLLYKKPSFVLFLVRPNA